jgi:succinate dehydrogenase / fumarate reductase iron-sulfur subunit
MLFTSAKVSQLALLPQGKVEAATRVRNMTNAMQECGFGNCTNHYECGVVCPKGVNVKFIARMNREFLKAQFA